MLACFPNGIAKIGTISELPNIFAHFFRKILSKMFCRQSSAVEGCAGPPRYHGATLFSGANAVSAHSTRRACLCFTIFSSLPNFSAPRLPRITFHPYFLTTLIYTASHTLTCHSSPRVHASFFCLFSLSERNGISYRENVLSCTGGL